jgi:hypothetical protein
VIIIGPDGRQFKLWIWPNGPTNLGLRPPTEGKRGPGQSSNPQAANNSFWNAGGTSQTTSPRRVKMAKPIVSSRRLPALISMEYLTYEARRLVPRCVGHHLDGRGIWRRLAGGKGVNGDPVPLRARAASARSLASSQWAVPSRSWRRDADLIL